MIPIHFIVNPVAGRGTSSLTKEVLEPYFINGVHQLTVKYAAYKKHAIELTLNSIEEKAAIIVACGGDGTINEVGNCLVGSTIPLGILPIGSGNGLASNLRIPKNIRKALHIIKNGHAVEIDVGQINDRHFFSNMGIGFDASVIKNYESSQRRSLFGYVNACFTSFREIPKNKELSVRINDVSNFINPFLIMVSNSNEMGYHISLTPKASLQDGLLDVLIVSKINRLKMLWLGVLILFRRVYWLKEVKSFQTKNLQLSCSGATNLESQIDGELHQIKYGRMQISVKEKSLRILVAK